MVKITVLDGYTLNPGDLEWTGLMALGEVEVFSRTDYDLSKIIERSAGAEILLTNKTPLISRTISALPDLKYIGLLSTGYNVVDIEAAAAKSIPVTNIPTYGTDSVAQMAFSHLLNFYQPVAVHSDRVKEGAWSSCPDFCFWDKPLIELKGKTIGIIGFGRIGRKLGKIANAFGMKVIAYDSFHGKEPGWSDFKWGDFNEILEESDVLSLHCPLTAENHGMINKDTLKKMKETVFLLNMSRGPLIVESDLADALKNGLIAGAGIDVLEQEPPKEGNLLFDVPNITITPHIAWATKEARSRLLGTAVENVRCYLNGKLQNVVNNL